MSTSACSTTVIPTSTPTSITALALASRRRSATVPSSQFPTAPSRRCGTPQPGTISPRIGFAYDVFGDGKYLGPWRLRYLLRAQLQQRHLQPDQEPAQLRRGRHQAVIGHQQQRGSAGRSIRQRAIASKASLRHVRPEHPHRANLQFHSIAIDQQLAARRPVLEGLLQRCSWPFHLYDIKNYNIPGSGNLYLLAIPSRIPSQGTAPSPASTTSTPTTTTVAPTETLTTTRLTVQLTTQDISHHTGLSLVANYTFAHALDDLSTTFSETSAGNFSASAALNPFNPAL